MKTLCLLSCIVVALNIFSSSAIEVTFKGQEYFSFSLKNYPIRTDRNTITLRFKTIHPSGLVFYSRGRTDYIQLELINGALK